MPMLTPHVDDFDLLLPEVQLDCLYRGVQKVVRDGLPVNIVQPWLDTLGAVAAPQTAHERAPQDLLVLALHSRRLDLLDAVLRSAPFRHRATFMGLPFAVAHPDPTSQPGWTGEERDGEPRAERQASAAAVLLPDEQERLWHLMQTHQPILAGFRAHAHVNVVGLAVMMGWHDGLRLLVEHGVPLYARSRATSEAQLFSPLLLAVHHQDPLAVAAVMAHPQLDPFRRFGPDDHAPMAHHQGLPAGVRFHLQHRTAPHRLELGVVLDDERLMNDARVVDAMGAWLSPWDAVLGQLDHQLLPVQQRRLETVRLHRVAHDAQSGASLGTVTRARL